MYDSCKVALATLCCFYFVLVGWLVGLVVVLLVYCWAEKDCVVALDKQVKDERMENDKCWWLWGGYLYWQKTQHWPFPCPQHQRLLCKTRPLVLCISSIVWKIVYRISHGIDIGLRRAPNTVSVCGGKWGQSMLLCSCHESSSSMYFFFL
jgi:hypothetical protein